MIDGARVFVVVPAFAEEDHIARVIESMPSDVDHVIVVDDASHDRTFEIARNTADPRVIALLHDHNRGVGAAIVTGYRHALAMPGEAHDAFVVMAGDGQMDPHDLPALVSPIARGDADYVKGDRFAWKNARAVIPRTRFVAGHVMSALTRVAIALPIHDSQCGFTAISRAACERLDLDALWPRFGYPNDLLAMLARKNLVLAEVPVRPVYTRNKNNKLGARHVPIVTGLIARAWIRRLTRG